MIEEYLRQLADNRPAAAMFMFEMIKAVNRNKKVNLLIQDSVRPSFTDQLVDMDVNGNTIELLFAREAPVKFVFSLGELSMPMRQKFHVNHENGEKNITIRLCNREKRW